MDGFLRATFVFIVISQRITYISKNGFDFRDIIAHEKRSQFFAPSSAEQRYTK